MNLNNNCLFFNDLIQWIERNLEGDLRLETVANKAGYSKWYLQRKFRLHSGMCLGTYIRKRRLTLAAISLKATFLSPAEIALIYRWDSQQTFTRTFKKYFGCPPVQWRNKCDWDVSNLQMPLYGKPDMIENVTISNYLTDAESSVRHINDIFRREDKVLSANKTIQ